MDDKDLQILRMLRDDARAPLKALAAKVGLARSSVRERIAKLESAGTLRGYRAEVSLPRDGVRAILLVRLDNTPNPGAVGKICVMKSVLRCYSVSGDTDLIVEVEGENMSKLNAARDAIARIPDVADVTTAPILNVDKE
jgi:DNA-binding Lrp family transcriptional regulator